MTKRTKIGELKFKVYVNKYNIQTITFKVFKLNEEYLFTYDNPSLMAQINKHQGNHDLGNLIFTIKRLEELNIELISDTIPKEIMGLANKEAILIRLE